VLQALADPRLIADFGNAPQPRNLIASEFRKGSAMANAFVALLASVSPRNLVNGSAIDTAKALSAYNRKEFHHIFPQAFLRGKGLGAGETNSLANFCMLSSEQNKQIGDRPPSEYIAEIKTNLGAEFGKVLESNLIPEEAVEKLLKDDYAGFLEVRAKHLIDVISTRI
jgi:hypothetical protein